MVLVDDECIYLMVCKFLMLHLEGYLVQRDFFLLVYICLFSLTYGG